MIKLNIEEINEIDWTSSVIHKMEITMDYVETFSYTLSMLFSTYFDGYFYKLRTDLGTFKIDTLPYEFDSMRFSSNEIYIQNTIKIVTKSQFLFYRLDSYSGQKISPSEIEKINLIV
jgi:hypothetical protein